MALKAKRQSCTKVWIFNVLLGLCLVSVLLFYGFFNLGHSFIPSSSPPSEGGDNSKKKGQLSVVEGPGPLLEARGKVVKPQANVKVPWVPDTTTTLCPPVPPELGESHVIIIFSGWKKNVAVVATSLSVVS